MQEMNMYQKIILNAIQDYAYDEDSNKKLIYIPLTYIQKKLNISAYKTKKLITDMMIEDGRTNIKIVQNPTGRKQIYARIEQNQDEMVDIHTADELFKVAQKINLTQISIDSEDNIDIAIPYAFLMICVKISEEIKDKIGICNIKVCEDKKDIEVHGKEYKHVYISYPAPTEN